MPPLSPLSPLPPSPPPSQPSPASPAPVNKAELLKKAKDGYDVLADLFRYSESGDFASLMADEAAKSDIEMRFRWFGVYQQKPRNGYFMFRIRIPGGQLNPRQLRTIADLADQYGRGFTDITTRQTIQFHWLDLKSLKPVILALQSVGLSSQFACGDVPRNIVCCPLAGVAEDEILPGSDALAQTINQMFVTSGKEFSNLPRKFKQSISGCPLHCQLPHIHDISFYGVKKNDGQTGYGLMVGGGLSDSPMFAQPLRAFVKPEQVVQVAHAVATLFRDQGYREKRGRARLKFLVSDKGWQWTRTEIEKILGYELEHDDSLLWPEAQHTDHMGTGKQKDGNHYVGLPIERGRWTARQMRTVADLADRHATGQKRIRLTLKQNALILDVPQANLSAVNQGLQEAGISPDAHRLRSTLMSCTGSEFCNLAVVETKNRAGRVLRWLEQNVPDLDRNILISFTGCPNACAQYQIADIGLTGIPVVLKDEPGPDGKPRKVDGYNVLLGAGIGADPKFGEVIAKKIPGDLIHLSLKNLLETYGKERIDDEETFRAWVARSEPEYLQMLIVQPTQVGMSAALTA